MTGGSHVPPDKYLGVAWRTVRQPWADRPRGRCYTEAFPCPNTKLIGFRNSHPCHRYDINFINLNDLSSPLLLPCQSSWIKFELPRVLHHKSSMRISSSMSITNSARSHKKWWVTNGIGWFLLPKKRKKKTSRVEAKHTSQICNNETKRVLNKYDKHW